MLKNVFYLVVEVEVSFVFVEYKRDMCLLTVDAMKIIATSIVKPPS